ncbi:esterase/lipase family protein [Paenibacillus hunanensis]|uniref:Triacylglycerol lipase n=1 Tax=Paenibacillus hunanensis TaxID=539262 RepID=A0ABU1J2R2_9BACL|nr:alpha/beta fold hydrolase [Paenibacillus hunanensis]MCL9661581.1 alpha/beta fold hydrolase [Paenibacillus hunanensis]MDR6244887.1 triacylglycerol lipase [Paenibacillus hunanensis]GGJ04904.1 lipase EstA [Paenibacillus hunanensis]
MMKRIFSLRLAACMVLLFALVGATGAVKPAQAATTHTPIIFVHGLGGSASNFTFIESFLARQGWSSNEMYAIDLPTKNGVQTLNAAAIRNLVDDVLARTGSTKVNIVAHSMGGANSLYYILNYGGASKVDKLITLGGANRLTTNSAPAGVNVTSIYSINDQVVSNYLSNLDGANNIRIYGVMHIGLLANSTVNGHILDALQQ